MKKIILILLLIAIILILITLLFFSTEGILGDCAIDDITRIENPNNQYEARVFKRDCGATTSIATVVAIRGKKHISESQDIFVVAGDVPILIYWTDINELLILTSFDNSLESDLVYKKVLNWDSIRITYERNSTRKRIKGHP